MCLMSANELAVMKSDMLTFKRQWQGPLSPIIVTLAHVVGSHAGTSFACRSSLACAIVYSPVSWCYRRLLHHRPKLTVVKVIAASYQVPRLVLFYHAGNNNWTFIKVGNEKTSSGFQIMLLASIHDQNFLPLLVLERLLDDGFRVVFRLFLSCDECNSRVKSPDYD